MLDDLDALLVPYGGPAGFWRLCTDRPDVAEAALEAAEAAGAGDDPAVKTLTVIVAAQRAAAADGASVAFTFVDDDGRLEHAVPGASPN